MDELDDRLETDELQDPIVNWRPERGPLIGKWDAPVVVAATVGALALLGFTAGAYLAGRAQGRRDYH